VEADSRGRAHCGDGRNILLDSNNREFEKNQEGLSFLKIWCLVSFAGLAPDFFPDPQITLHDHRFTWRLFGIRH
jgi:hypothetical protein